MASNLPPEMIESILLKLPVKSMLRFKSVSKSWNTIISDRAFVRNHHLSSESQNVFLRKIIISYNCYGLCLVKLEDGKLQITEILKLPYSDATICYCEYGVLLLADFSFNRCLLWNPSTQTTTQLSLPYNGCSVSCSGICYDLAIDDFKVVFLYGDFYLVYSCKTKSWSNRKALPHTISSFQPAGEKSGVSIDGAIYWLFRDNIVYYDARDDKLKIFEKPEDVHDFLNTHLVDLGGHLCMYGYCGNVMRIWKKEKGIDNNSWKEFITIHNNVDKRIWLLEPLRFVGNKIVMQDRGDKDKLLVFNPLEKTMEQVEEKLIGMGSLIPYRETLYFLT